MRKIIGNYIGHNLKGNLSLGHSLFMALVRQTLFRIFLSIGHHNFMT
jgi:hypothetical protein